MTNYMESLEAGGTKFVAVGDESLKLLKKTQFPYYRLKL